MTDPKKQEAAAPIQVELSQEDLVRILAGELDVDAMIEEANKRAAPRPTLSSVRAQIENWKASRDTNLRDCIENRVKLSSGFAAKIVLAALLQDDLAMARRLVFNAQPNDESRAALEPLSDEEFRTYVIMRAWDSPSVACALGMHVGAMLMSAACDKFNFDDLHKLAMDPVFCSHVYMGQIDQSNVSCIATKCLKEIDKLATLD
jgi:hypothetical protein